MITGARGFVRQQALQYLDREDFEIYCVTRDKRSNSVSSDVGSYHPESVRGVGSNDPSFAIKWPLPYSILSEKDINYSISNGRKCFLGI
jgi:hypothetical protein